jgi:hypothetical protein
LKIKKEDTMSEEKKNLLAVQDFDAEALKEMAELASRDNEAVQPRLPTLKINYDESSKFKRGSWVVGQIKDKDGNITEEGKQATHFIVLKVKNSFSYYNKEDTTKNCHSSIVDNFKPTSGKYGVCGSKCIYRSEDINPRCSAQKVVFGVALAPGEDGKMEKIDCIARFKGQSYMPFMEFYDTLPRVKVTVDGKVKEMDFPIYSFINKLDSESGKNGSLTYYIAKFTREKTLKRDDVIKLAEKAKRIDGLVDTINSIGPVEGEDEVPSSNNVSADFSRRDDNVKEAVPVTEDEKSFVDSLFDD